MFEIINKTEEEISEIEDIKRALNRAIIVEEPGEVVFNVILTNNEFLHELNLKYREIDRTTDVITFALEDCYDMPRTEVRILGDIYISVEKAHSQSIEYGHSFKREICFLAVHGFLHLLGYDHMLPGEEKVMFDRQELILNEEGITK